MGLKYYYDDQMEEDEMGGACGTYGGSKKCMQRFAWKARRNRQHGRLRYVWEDNVKMDLREIMFWYVNLVHLAQDRTGGELL
jgi:hypothetical protein